ncbi:MAG TPA: hypothetical protein VIY10_21290 [Solirubrobacteraceae bacterium]
MRGSVTYEGRGQARCEVRLCDLDAGEVVAAATTDAGGRYELAGPRPAHALAVARCVDQAIGVAGADLGGVEDVQLKVESGGTVFPVTVELAAHQELPASLDLTLDAVEIADAPALWLSALKVPFQGVTRAGFASRPLSDQQTVLQVQAGRWRIAAQRVVVTTAQPQGAEPEPSWFTEAATVDGREVPAVDMAVELQVDGPLHVVLHLAPART